jgi:aminopeptidase N
MTAFRSWRALESGRRGKAEASLQRIAATAKLSADVRDIVSRALAPA